MFFYLLTGILILTIYILLTLCTCFLISLFLYQHSYSYLVLFVLINPFFTSNARPAHVASLLSTFHYTIHLVLVIVVILIFTISLIATVLYVLQYIEPAKHIPSTWTVAVFYSFLVCFFLSDSLLILHIAD
jgi:hypothetical protein